MKGIQFIVGVLFMLWLSSAYAGNYTCTGTPVTGKDFSMPSVNLTLGSGIADFTQLYTVTYPYVSGGINGDACGSRSYNFVATLTDITSGTSYTRTLNGMTHKIFPTSVSGIGISDINLATGAGGAKRPVPAWPDTIIEYVSNGFSGYAGSWYTVYIWKIPGELPAASGGLDFTGPTIRFLIMPYYAGDKFSSSTYPSYEGYLEQSSVRFKGTTSIINGTCDIVMGSKTIQMGTFGGGQNSSWVDSSFKLNCPNAYGYGGDVTGATGYDASGGTRTPNSIKNNPVRIQIIPYTPVVDAAKGIMELYGSGAEGYGLQLAWGDVATLGTGDPSNPVQLNAWVAANTLNSVYSASPYAIGAAPISSGADGTIKMAARYIRTSGPTSGGPANAAVEVLASYE